MSDTLTTFVTVAVSNIISGIFIGAGIFLGIYYSLKRRIPTWIKEITQELRKDRAIENALQSRKNYTI